MTEPKHETEPLKLLSMRFRLKPVDTIEASEKTSGKTPLEQPQLSFRHIGEQFSTKLLLLWTYMNEIGRVADATTFTNMASTASSRL